MTSPAHRRPRLRPPVWASEADHDAFRATEPANKLRAALESRVDEGKAAAEPGARYAGVIVNQAASAAGSFAAVAAAPLVHVGSYRVPASVAPADFEKAWEALCAKAGGPPPGAVAGPTHGWGKEPAPDGSGDRIFVVTGGWESREKYDAVAADPGHPAALPLMGLATRAQSKFAVFEKLK